MQDMVQHFSYGYQPTKPDSDHTLFTQVHKYGSLLFTHFLNPCC